MKNGHNSPIAHAQGFAKMTKSTAILTSKFVFHPENTLKLLGKLLWHDNSIYTKSQVIKSA